MVYGLHIRNYISLLLRLVDLILNFGFSSWRSFSSTKYSWSCIILSEVRLLHHRLVPAGTRPRLVCTFILWWIYLPHIQYFYVTRIVGILCSSGCKLSILEGIIRRRDFNYVPWNLVLVLLLLRVHPCEGLAFGAHNCSRSSALLNLFLESLDIPIHLYSRPRFSSLFLCF